MKKMIYLMVMGFAMLQTVQAQTFNPNLSAILQARLDSLVTAFSGNTQGVSIGIYCPGQGYWTGVSGVSHAGTNLTQDMKIGLASNSKMFIAVTMLRMDEEQIIDLDNPISTWLPAIANVDPTITVRQLLNHTSGVSDPFFSTALLDSINAHPDYVYTTAEVLSMVGVPLFPVGTSYSYSNTNYILAGMIAENATGQTMAELVRNYIFAPLALNNSFYDYLEPEIAPLAHRWHDNVDYNNISRISLNSAGGAAGAIFSTGEDMVHWYHALMDGQVLNQTSFDELTDFISFGAIGNYGLGIQKSVFFNRETWGHGGTTHGSKTRSVYDPCNKLVVCGLANSDWAAIDGITLLMYRALLENLPDCSAAVTGESTVCQGQQGVTYTVPPIPNATSYEWTLPNGFLGVSATNTITLDFSLAAMSGNISVKGINMYGEGAPSTFPVTVNPIPTTPIISGLGNTLNSDAPIGNQWYDQNGPLAGETNSTFNFLIGGNYYTIVTLQGCSSEPSNTINTIELSIDESNFQEMQIFPNPTDDLLTLKFNGNTNVLSYSITNVINQEVMKGYFIEQEELHISPLEIGIYMLCVEDGDRKIVKRIIKK